MAHEDKRSDKADAIGGAGAQPDDEATQLKKRARRRLIGAVALALLAAIVLPMVMDHQPAPPLKDIQVRIPSPDEGVTQRVSPGKPISPRKEEKPQALAPEPAPAVKDTLPPASPVAKPEPRPEAKPEGKPDPKPAGKPESKPEPKPEPRSAAKPEVASGPPGGEAWEVQLGAYQEPQRVINLVNKLKELGIPTYTEKVDTPNGSRTRVRAGPFPTQEAAEKARARVKIVGVDGPVARKP